MLTNPIIRLLHRRIGLDPESLGVRVIADCMGDLMGDLAQAYPGQTADAIAIAAARDTQLFDQIVGYFAVNESWLFRNPTQFAQLGEFAQQHLQKKSGPLRALSLPAACGEEPASIAITLHEAGFALHDFSIVAGELDLDALTKARSGSFPSSAFRTTPPDPRWFRTLDQRHQLLPALHARIDYRQLNVLSENLFLGELFDVIFCRNLLIYLHADARTQVLALLQRIAAPGALICTGTAEDAITAGCFVQPTNERKFARETTRENVHALNPFLKVQPLPTLRRFAAAEFPMLPGPQPAESVKDNLQQRLLGIEHSANSGDFFNANSSLDLLLSEFPVSAEAWFLRGVLASAQAELPQAAAALARANYLDPNHARALQLRAELAKRTGDVAQANRLSAQLKRRSGE